MVVKEGMVYRLTEKGRELARFVKDVDRIWSKLESTLSGEHTSVFSCAEQFEAETGIKMQKTTSMFHGMDLIMDERRVIGILAQEDCSRDFFVGYKPLRVEDFQLCLKNCVKGGKKVKELVLGHPDLRYHLSPAMLGMVHQ